MAISRPFLLAVLGALLFGVTVLAVQNARTTDNDATPAVIQTQATPAPGETTSTSAPADTLRSAFDLSDVHSARFLANLAFVAPKAEARFAFAGAFDRTGDSPMPRFRVRAQLRVGRESESGDFVSLGGRAYFVRGDEGWRVPAALWGPLVQKLPLGIHPQAWVRDVKSKGSERVAGVATEHLVARVDPKAVLDDWAGITGGTVNERALKRRIKRAELEVWVGKDDHTMHQFELRLIGPHNRGIDMGARLLDVNKPQRIGAPAHVRSGAPTGAFGALAQLFANGIGGATGADTNSLAVLTSPNPARAARAVRKHKKVVILFGNPRGLDDRAMLPVMRSVDKRTKALVLIDHVDAADRYGKLPEDLAISQTPSVVIIDRRGRARLIEGFVDSNTLTQAVADAR